MTALIGLALAGCGYIIGYTYSKLKYQQALLNKRRIHSQINGILFETEMEAINRNHFAMPKIVTEMRRIDSDNNVETALNELLDSEEQ